MTAFYIASFPEPFVFEAGLPAASALAFKETLGLTNAELAALLGVSVRTLARWDPSRSRLDLVSGDRLVRSARLFGIAAEVLEDAEAAARWMKTPQRALGGAVPLRGDSVALLVPSVLIPQEYCLLLNPTHPDARKVMVRYPEPFRFDGRL